MINRVVLVGRLTKDPELRYTPSGLAVCRFTVAVNRTFTDQSGEKTADFINCVAWRKQAENLANFQKKGALIGVEGRIQTGSYEGQDGKKVFTTEIVSDSIQFLEPRSNSGQQQNNQQQQGGYTGGQQNQQGYNGQQQQGGYNQQQKQQQNYNNQQQQGGYSNQPPQQQNYGGGQGFNNQQNSNGAGGYNDPFANPNQNPIEVSEDDLPF